MGYYNYGQGFIFADNEPNCESLAELERLFEKNPRNRERVFAFIGGDEFLENPLFESQRYIIDFGDMTELEAQKWPDLFAIVKRRVKPERESCNRERLRNLWWQFGEVRPGLRLATTGKSRILMHPFTTKHLAFGFVPANVYIASPHYAIMFENFAGFASLQCRIHEVWARFFASSLEDRMRYTASDCFETFPFPHDWEVNPGLEVAGGRYYSFRGAVMAGSHRGLTSTYNRFHDPDERSPEILQLRELHAGMDRAALDAYGWADIQPSCEFLLDYEEEEDENAIPSRRQKPWRYRWPDETRDEVLGRLLVLNKERAEEEGLRLPRDPSVKRVKRKRVAADSDTADLFGRAK